MQRDATPNARDGDPRQHVVVAGGGILGCLTSLLLAECGRAVTLVDAGRGIQSKDRLDSSGRRKSEEDS